MIDKEFLMKWCEKANSKDSQNNLGDRTIVKIFKTPITSVEDSFLRLISLDYLWSTNLRKFIKNKGLSEISENLMKIGKEINEKISMLPSADLLKLDLNEKNCQIILDCVELMISCCNNKGLSFPCKYLHFLKPSLFVPWDNSVPKSIEQLMNIRLEMSKEGYIQLLKIYKQIAERLTENDRGEVINFDYTTQQGNPIKNTFIRTIDKALWGYQKYKEG
jgi:hypothetical protein